MNENLDKIRRILLDEREARVVDLSRRLHLSEVSVRKHLSELEREGVVVRRYGGALLIENPQDVNSTSAKQSIRPGEKKAIARAAADLISDGENLLLDTGSTMLALAGLLHSRSVRVVTNSIAIADELTQAPDVTVEVVGGSLRKMSGALIGPRTVSALSEIRVDKAFLACSGFDPTLGFSSENTVEAETKEAMLRCGKEKILLADHSKFERPAFANFAGAVDFDHVITDRRTEAVRKLNGRVSVTIGK